MINKLFYKASGYLDFVPVNLLAAITGKRTIFPFYHTVSNNDLIHIKHLYTPKSVREFEKDLDFFLKIYKPVDLQTVLDSINNHKPLKENSFLLSFDDGLREFYEIIAPILLQKGIPAICFINNQFLDNKDIFFRYKASIIIEKILNSNSNKQKLAYDFLKDRGLLQNDLKTSILNINYPNKVILDNLATLAEIDFSSYLQEYKPYLNSEQVYKLIEQGFTFGGHSIDHPLYAEITLAEQIEQTKQSTEGVSNTFNLKEKIFAFPFTDTGVSKQFFDHIYKGDKSIVDISFGTSGLKEDITAQNIQRIPCEIGQLSAENIVKGEYLYYMLKAIVRKNQIQRD